ncbi:MAG: hypothetical protein ACI4F1_02370 [Bariatricus sp.]
MQTKVDEKVLKEICVTKNEDLADSLTLFGESASEAASYFFKLLEVVAKMYKRRTRSNNWLKMHGLPMKRKASKRDNTKGCF